MFVVLCVAIIALYLAYLPLFFKVEAAMDMEAGAGSVSFTLFGIPVFTAQGLLEIRSLTESDLIIMHRKRQRNVHIKIDRRSLAETIEVIKSFEFSIFSNLNVRNVHLKVKYGNGDAFKTTFYLGIARIVFYSIMSAVKSAQAVEVSEEFTPDYNMRELKGYVSGIFSLSLADIIYGFLRGRLHKWRSKSDRPQKSAARLRRLVTK